MTPNPRLRLCAVVLAASTAVLSSAAAPVAGPVDFGKMELRRALAVRGLSLDSIAIDVQAGVAETWSIASGHIVGGDERGLMYGLLEAAEQIRDAGRLTPASGRPATPLRGIRCF